MITIDGVEYTEDCFEPTGTSAKTRSHIKKTLRDRLKDTYGSTKYKEFLKIQGFDDARFDYVGSVMNMMYADLTTDGIDNNANKDSKSVSRVEAEVDNANHKIAGHDALYRMMKKLYGKEEAVRLSSEMYDYTLGLNDATKILRVYCWALSGIPLVLEGRKGNPVCAPAKHLHSYVSMLAGTIHELSNSHLAGAIAVGSFFFDVARVLIMDGYSLDDIKEGAGRKYVTQMFQQFVFDVNDKTRIGSETPFTNLSFFDRPKMRAMLEDLEWYFDATGKDLDYIQEYVMECQRIMMDFMDIGDPITKLPFTFPVQTACIAKDKDGNILDMEFVSDLVKRPVHHYNILVSEGTKIASCCFDGNQKVVVKFNNSNIVFDTFENVFTKYSFNATSPRILHNGRWKAFNKVQVPYSKEYYKITTMNNKEIVVTEDHLNPTLRGDVVSSNLTTDDYLLFNTIPLATAKETDHNYTYEDGYAIGLFLGDGSYIKYSTNDEVVYTGVNYSLNSDCFDECKDKIDFFLKKYDCCSKLGTIQNNVYPLIFRNAEATAFIKRFVDGESALTKELKASVLYESIEFRKGILDGWYASDGGNSNRAYSISKKLIDSMELLCTSLGLVTVINVNDRTGEGEVVIRGEQFNRNYPLWCLRWYDTQLRSSYTDLYKKLNNSIYFKIKSIEKCEGTGTAYCIQVKDGDYEPYFTLPNGIITHNCRLLSDGDMMNNAGSVNSFGGGGSISMGSHRVVCINLNRCAIMSESEKDFVDRLDSLVYDCVKILKAHKELLYKLTEVGLQPKIADGTIDLSRCFSTVGTLGLWEMLQTLEKRFGSDEDRDVRIMKHFNDTCIKAGKQYGLNVNIEAIPGEAMAERFCKSDKLLFGDKIVPYEIYSNQTVPLTEKVDVYDRMDKDGRINLLLTGGGIVHLTIGERITPEQALNLIKYAVKSCCEHFALNLVHSMCEDGHVSEGKYTTCPVCGKPVVDYALRIVGFLRPVSSWSKVRRLEFENRFIIPNSSINNK